MVGGIAKPSHGGTAVPEEPVYVSRPEDFATRNKKEGGGTEQYR